MKCRHFHQVVYFGAVALFLLAVVSAHGQDQMRREYRPVLEMEGEQFAAGLSGEWIIVEGDDIHGQPVPADTGRWRMDDARSEGSALVLTPGEQPLSLVSPLLPLEKSCVALSGTVLGSGENEVKAYLQWVSGKTVVHTEPLREPPVSSAAQRRFNLNETERPEGARAMRVVVTVMPKDKAAFVCSVVRIAGLFSTAKEVSLFYNKIGYEQVEAKTFTVGTNFVAIKGAFYLEDALGKQLYEGTLSHAENIRGAGGVAWNDYYCRGNFSSVEEEGDFTLTVTMDGGEPVSVPVRIRFNLLWDEAFAPAVAPFKQLRVTDSTESDTLSLWNPAFAGAATDASLLWDIVRSCSILQGRFRTDPAFVPLHDEVLYGVGKLTHWLQAGHSPANEQDMELYAATLACCLRMFREDENVAAAARLLAERVIAEGLTGPLPFSAVMDMYEATGENRYFEHARQIFPGVSMERIEPLLSYEDLAGAMVTIDLINRMNTLGESVANNAKNPFGLTASAGMANSFFVWDTGAPDPLRGNNTRILAVAETMAQAYRYTAKSEFKTVVFDQFNWLMGNNPFGTCLVAGLCDSEAPPVALLDGLTRENAYGAVLHGIGPCAADSDKPCFGMTADEASESTNGFSLHNNARYISAMAYMKRIPVARPKKAGL